MSLHVLANYEVFGEGLAGTLGVPDLSVGARPVLGTGVPIHLGSSVGVTSPGFVISGTRADYQPTPWGGVFLVAEPGKRVMQLPPSVLNRVFHVPSSSALIGSNIVLQLLVRDPGAPNGFSFSRGLRLTLGE